MEPDIIKRLRAGESIHDNPNFSESDGAEIIAYTDRITAHLSQTGDGWIKCSERLPEIDEVVLWYSSEVGRIVGLFEMDKDMDWQWVKDSYKEYTPTHWRPLPLPPADDKGE